MFSKGDQCGTAYRRMLSRCRLAFSFASPSHELLGRLALDQYYDSPFSTLAVWRRSQCRTTYNSADIYRGITGRLDQVRSFLSRT